jgi:hypothetical protein
MKPSCKYNNSERVTERKFLILFSHHYLIGFFLVVVVFFYFTRLQRARLHLKLDGIHRKTGKEWAQQL